MRYKTLLTNEWNPVDKFKMYNREVLCRFSDGKKRVCTWNGRYWKDQDGKVIDETVGFHITHFLIFTKDINL